MKTVIETKECGPLPVMMKSQQLKVLFIACTWSMDIMGIGKRRTI